MFNYSKDPREPKKLATEYKAAIIPEHSHLEHAG